MSILIPNTLRAESFRWCVSLCALLLFGTLSIPQMVSASTPEILDEAGIFSAEAEREATLMIRRTARATSPSKSIVVHSITTLPDSSPSPTSFSESLFEVRGLQGVQILTISDPPTVVVTFGAATEERVADRDTVTRILLDYFSRRDYDGGLQAAVRALQTELTSRFPANRPQWWRETPAKVVLIVLFVIIGVFALPTAGSAPHPVFVAVGTGLGTWFTEGIRRAKVVRTRFSQPVQYARTRSDEVVLTSQNQIDPSPPASPSEHHDNAGTPDTAMPDHIGFDGGAAGDS